jgi:hypothetical protein
MSHNERCVSARKPTREKGIAVAEVEGPTGVASSRRAFVKLNLLGAALLPIAGLLVSENAQARQPRTGEVFTPPPPVRLDPDDPQAKSLSYTAYSAKDGQDCSNCALYTGTEGDDIGPCAIFSYRVAPGGGQLMVVAGGWCRAWIERQPA